MDEFDVFTPKPFTVEEEKSPELENTEKTTNNQVDGFAWMNEDNPDPSTSVEPVASIEDNITSSYNDFPPTAEDILFDDLPDQESENKYSFNMFSNEESSPLYAITKKREEEIAAKDTVENQKIEELRQQAKNDLERWYNERQKQIEQKKQVMRNEENVLNAKSLETSTKESCNWSKVIRLLDFTDGTQLSKSKRDLTRMKSCMFNAKRVTDQKNLANGK